MKREKRKLLPVAAGLALTLCCCLFLEGKSLPLIQKTSAEVAGTPLLVLCYEDISPEKGSKEKTPLSTLKSDIAFLKQEGYTFLNSEDLLAFSMGLSDLPEKAVWLTFDEGHESFYNLVYPLLTEQQVKADVNLIGSYTDLYSENLELRESGYLSWMQAAELDRSPLIAMGSMGYDLNEKKLFGRQGAAIKKKESYESYREFLCADLVAMEKRLNRHLSHDSRVFCYPHGIFCEESEQILTDELGFLITLTRKEGLNFLTDKSSLYALQRYVRNGKKSTEEFFKKINEY